ncbi:MAG: polysaccharide biosynthesis tyrosine autokinase [Solirubrobacteraceae bacterium]
MTAERLLRTVWRRKWYAILTVVAATAGAYLVSRSLPKVYSTSSTLFIGNDNPTSTSYEALQSDQLLAKTYSELIQSQNVAARVATTLAAPPPAGSGPAGAAPERLTPDAILARMSFKPVTDTQLISITAEGPSAAQATRLANTYASTFERYANTLLAQRTKSTVSVVDQARVPSGPIRPKPKLYAAIMFVLALFLGVAVALARDRFDRTLGDEDELGEEVGLAVLGHVPLTPVRRPSRVQQQLFLEAFRVLRTNLQFLRGRDHQITCLAICSAGAGEGKSTTVVGLAQSIAEQRHRVLIIEGDLRRPSLAPRLGVDPMAPGVAHFLAMSVGLDEVVHETDIPGVMLMPAGAVPISPSALLTTEEIHRLVDGAAASTDYSLIDCPPRSAGADATLLADAADGVLFVVNRRRTPRTQAVQAIRAFQRTGSALVGIVVNESTVDEGTYGGYYTTDGPAIDDALPPEIPALREPG